MTHTSHPTSNTKFKVGDRVRVKTASEILDLLDRDARYEGLPFMPQMSELCGREFEVTRWVNNVCFQSESGANFARLANCVLLNVARCDGASYGGCQMGCPLIWKTAWVGQSDMPSGSDVTAEGGDSKKSTLLELAQQNIGDPAATVSCQATELYQITDPRGRLSLEQYKDELNLNRVSAMALASSMCSGLLARFKGEHNVTGVLKRTPVQDLGLAKGDVVQVKTKEEIIKTLDQSGKNRGLWFDPVMLRFCGQKLVVTKRIDTLVDEITGKVRKLKTPSVVLDDLHCQPGERRFCSRLLMLFWREIWLERV